VPDCCYCLSVDELAVCELAGALDIQHEFERVTSWSGVLVSTPMSERHTR